jgi:hypothetical protein
VECGCDRYIIAKTDLTKLSGLTKVSQLSEQTQRRQLVRNKEFRMTNSKMEHAVMVDVYFDYL